MEFVNPSIFYYLLLLAIPIIIHLFNFRKHTKVLFSSNYFLKELVEKTKATYQIKRWIILFVRIMAFTSIIMAFAIPYVKNKNYTGDAHNVAIYIDNSFSMDRNDTKKIKLIDHAKRNAQNIISKLKDSQKVLLLTNDFNKNHQKWHSPKDAIQLINNIEISGNTPGQKTIINRYHHIIDSSRINSLYIFSDFQKEKTNFNNLNKDQKSRIKIGVLQSENTHNISIDSCYFSTPFRQKNKIENLIVALTNHSTKSQIIKTKLLINGQQKSIQNITIPPESKVHQNFYYSNPLNTENISGTIIIDESTMGFDNQLHFSYSTKEKVKVCIIYDKNPNQQLMNIFSDSLFQFTKYEVGTIEYNQLNKYDLIILDHIQDLNSSLQQQIKKFAHDNGNLFIFLDSSSNIDLYNNFFQKINTDFLSTWIDEKQKIEYINYDSDLFKNVFDKKIKNINLPMSNGYFQIQRNKKSQKRNILNFLNNDPFLSEYRYGKNRIFLCLSDLDLKHTNFSEHALFVPCLYNAALINMKHKKLYYIIQNETIIENNDIKKKDIVRLTKKDNFDMIPAINTSMQKTLLNFQDKIKFAGNYNLIQNDTNTTSLSFNYNRQESKLEFWNKNDIENFLPNNNVSFLKLDNNSILKKYKENQTTKSIEHFFIILAIILLIIELFLLRIWKV